MKNLFTIFLSLLICASIYAQDVDSTYSFNIYEAIEFAMQNQKDVLNAQLDADIAREKVHETVGIGLPQVTASFDVKDYLKIPTQFLPDFISPSVYNILYDENLITQKKDASGQLFPVQFGTKWNATAAISATQLIFDPSYLIGVKASKEFRELSRKNVERTKIETAIAVSKAYYMVLLIRERKKVIDANSERINKLLSDTKALFDNGFVEKMDYDRVQVAKNNMETEKENFIRLMDLSEKTLKYQIGLPYNTTLFLTDSIDVREVKKMKDLNEVADPTSRIEYSILKSQESLQQFNVRRYKGQYLPSLVAYGSLNTMAQRQEFNIFSSKYRWYPTGLVGATLSFNLFDGSQREFKIRQEKLTLRKIGNEISNVENAINLDVNSSRSALKDAIASLVSQEKNLELANSISRTSKIKYEQGVGSNLEVLDAETSLKESQVNYFNALYNAVITKIDLEKALGKFKY